MKTPEKTRASRAWHTLLFVVSSHWDALQWIQYSVLLQGLHKWQPRKAQDLQLPLLWLPHKYTGTKRFGGWLFSQSTGPRWDLLAQNTALCRAGGVTTLSSRGNCGDVTTAMIWHPRGKLFTTIISVDLIPANYTQPKHYTKFYLSIASTYPS